MDSADFAATAATALIAAMTTDAWHDASIALVKLWGRIHPGQDKAIASDLNDLHHALIVAKNVNDSATEAALTASWRLRLQGLLESKPDLADDLERQLAAIFREGSGLAHVEQIMPITIHANASGNARIYQAGRDMHIREH